MSKENQQDIPANMYRFDSLETDIHTIHYPDTYRDDDFAVISGLVAERMSEGFRGDARIDLTRKRTRKTMDLENEPTRWMYQELPGFADWHRMIPTAAALDPIYDPELERYATGEAPTPEIRVWFRNLYDAIGIRSRARAMEGLIVDEVLRDDRRQKWVSLACGTARPVFSALSEIEQLGGVVPDVTLADYDPQALHLAEEIAQASNLADRVTTKRMNILRARGIAARHQSGLGMLTNSLRSMGKLPAESFDMVDIVGLFEYLGDDDWSHKPSPTSPQSHTQGYDGVTKEKANLAGAVTFLENAYELVRPGGLLIVGNMRETHPQLGFTLNVIQWPHIRPRSLEQMGQIFCRAGLDGKIDVYCPDDNVYAIYAIRKDR